MCATWVLVRVGEESAGEGVGRGSESREQREKQGSQERGCRAVPEEYLRNAEDPPHS